MELRVDGPLPALEGVPGVSAVVVREGLLRCDLEGDVGPFLARLGGVHAVRDLTIEPARLEEAFLEYYAPENGVTAMIGALLPAHRRRQIGCA